MYEYVLYLKTLTTPTETRRWGISRSVVSFDLPAGRVLQTRQ